MYNLIQIKLSQIHPTENIKKSSSLFSNKLTFPKKKKLRFSLVKKLFHLNADLSKVVSFVLSHFAFEVIFIETKLSLFKEVFFLL
jgi:hypothetical protein